MPVEDSKDVVMEDTREPKMDKKHLRLWREEPGVFRKEIVKEIFDSLDLASIKKLESSGFLEDYLWPHFSSQSSQEHLLSILCVVNERARQNLPLWKTFQNDQSKFELLFQSLLPVAFQLATIPVNHRIIFITFLQNAFQSLEEETVSKNILRLISLPMWSNVNDACRSHILSKNGRLLKQWRHFESLNDSSKNPAAKKRKNQSGTSEDIDSKEAEEYYYEKNFMFAILSSFLPVLLSVDENSDALDILYCEKFVEWIKDLCAQLPTRRYLRLLLQSTFFLSHIRVCKLMEHPRGKLFQVMAEQLENYYFFEIDDFTGTVFTRDEIVERHYERIQTLQVLAYKFFSPTLRPFSLRNVGSIEERRSLRSNLSLLQPEELKKLAQLLHLISDKEEIETEILLEGIVMIHELRASKQETLANIPIYPNEDLLWQSALTSETNCVGSKCTTLPKLNLQFLSFYDYLLRNFSLYQLETAYQIRKDIEDVIQRLTPRLSDDRTRTLFLGWARMSSPISQFQMGEVLKPNLGERVPSSVTASIGIQMVSMRKEIKEEWMQIKPNDVMFLVRIRSPIARGGTPDLTLPFPDRYGVEAVRGCRVIRVLDSKGRIVGREITEDEKEAKRKKKRERARNYHWERFREKLPEEDVALEKRTFNVALDPNQYYTDLQNDREELYEATEDAHCFDVLIRRNPKENNFSGVLSTIRSMMNEDHFIVPDWFQDVFLGYGDPTEVSLPLESVRWLDTFQEISHVEDSFPGVDVVVENDQNFPLQNFTSRMEGKKMIVTPEEPTEGVTFTDQSKKGIQVRFTPAQAQGIASGMKEGLTVIMGPPGTGKTDVAVQLIHLLYHNHPEQRCLIITHSNQALNQIFEKLIQLDIDECHLLRVGHGENELDTTSSKNPFHYNQVGRIDFILAKRLELLKKVERLSSVLSCPVEFAYSCESAELFRQHTVLSHWNRFLRLCMEDTSDDSVAVHFPFTDFFAVPNQGKKSKQVTYWQSQFPSPLFTKKSRDVDMKTAEKCFAYITKIFKDLEAIRPFEVLRSAKERTNYLLMKQARVVAMTCTHAALRYPELVKIGFNVDNIIMEEAAQMLDIESFIPVLTRKPGTSHHHPLRRLVMLGDHHQLPPVVQNDVLKTYSHLDQSLFARFVRLGVPLIHLDKQGRSRASLASLYTWAYDNLSNLPQITLEPRFQVANAGLRYEYQFIDVPDYKGRGEQSPLPHFYQNLGEAEYVVAMYQYMRLLGYPAGTISIITSYNGQKELIRDIIKQRCANPIFGFPRKITTVDRFQGQQNDYILFSMVRTEHVGHIRDLRRLIVSMSRARLGLYIFGRSSLFAECQELAPVFSQLLARPLKLEILPAERFPTARKLSDNVESAPINNVEELLEINKQLAQAQLARR